MIKVFLNGYKGRMGQAISNQAGLMDMEIFQKADFGDEIKSLELCDVVIDFSFRDATEVIASYAVKHNKPLVIGTTGHTQEQIEKILALVENKIPVVWAGNYSVGVNLLNYLVKKATAVLGNGYNTEIVEMHHNKKKDAPSGTAQKLLSIVLEEKKLSQKNAIFGREGLIGERPEDEVCVHALRGGDVVGDHTVIFAADGERLELTHKASNRDIFAQGALRAGKWLYQNQSTISTSSVYEMSDVLGL